MSNTFKFFSKFCVGQMHPDPVCPTGHHFVTSHLSLPCPFLRTSQSLPYAWACWACERSLPTISLFSPHCVRAITDASGDLYVPRHIGIQYIDSPIVYEHILQRGRERKERRKGGIRLLVLYTHECSVQAFECGLWIECVLLPQ